MSNSYVLGRGRENNLIVKLRKKGWFAIRGSGSKAGMVIVEGKKYLKVWAKTVQAIPLLAFTFEKRSTKNKKRGSWVFIDLLTNENIEL